MAPLFSKVDLNKLWHYVQNEETLICAKFGKDLFNISKVIGRKKVALFFWLTVYLSYSDFKFGKTSSFDCRVLHTMVYCGAVQSAIPATAWLLVSLCDVICINFFHEPYLWLTRGISGLSGINVGDSQDESHHRQQRLVHHLQCSHKPSHIHTPSYRLFRSQ